MYCIEDVKTMSIMYEMLLLQCYREYDDLDPLSMHMYLV